MSLDFSFVVAVAGYLTAAGTWFRTRKYRDANRALSNERIRLLDGIRESLEQKVGESERKIAALEKQNAEQALAIRAIGENLTQSAKVQQVLEVSEVNRGHLQNTETALAAVMKELVQLRLDQQANAVEAAKARAAEAKLRTEEHAGIMASIDRLAKRTDPRPRGRAAA